MSSDTNNSDTERLIQDELSEEKMFAGLAVGSYWELDTGKQVQIRRAADAKDHGIRYVKLSSDTGDYTASDFLAKVQAGRHEPVGHRADQAYIFANRSVDTGTDRSGGDGDGE